MNAEDCPLHRPLIDRAQANGIFYPWTCECPEPGDPEPCGPDCEGPMCECDDDW